MIAAQRDRDFVRLQRLDHELRMLGAGCGNLLQIFRMRITFLLLLSYGDSDVSAVLDDVSDRLKTRLEAGDADRRRPHIHAAARLAEVERNANNTNLSRNNAREGWGSCSHKFELNAAMDTACAAFSQTESSREHAPTRRSMPPRARSPCQSPHGARFRISASRDTT